MTSWDNALLDRTIALARANVLEGGRPFACVIANSTTGEILAESGNKVAQSGNPTSHAEMEAIHAASAKLRVQCHVEYTESCACLYQAANVSVDGKNGTPGEDMKGYTFYILTEPCTMCMAAMAYSGPDRIVYSTTRAVYSQVMCSVVSFFRYHFILFLSLFLLSDFLVLS
jgi:tRNA(Arg) A34 adenosine deaminase TadA